MKYFFSYVNTTEKEITAPKGY